jgi:hypothetical protein
MPLIIFISLSTFCPMNASAFFCAPLSLKAWGLEKFSRSITVVPQPNRLESTGADQSSDKMKWDFSWSFSSTNTDIFGLFWVSPCLAIGFYEFLSIKFSFSFSSQQRQILFLVSPPKLFSYNSILSNLSEHYYRFTWLNMPLHALFALFFPLRSSSFSFYFGINSLDVEKIVPSGRTLF